MKFVMVGLGYISEKHMNAIKNVGGEIVAAYDPYSSVGKIDRFFDDTMVFNDFVLFDKYISTLKKVDYFVICTPNYTHSYYIRYAIDTFGWKVITEKPITTDYAEYKDCVFLSDLENIPVYPILQLRNNPELVALKERLDPSKNHSVKIDYITFRGDWYNNSWQLVDDKSGGILYNIGIHLIDMLCWIFGEPVNSNLLTYGRKNATFTIKYKNADVWVNLMLDKFEDKKSHRVMSIGTDYEIDLTAGFADFHTETYKKIIAGEWITIADASQTMALINELKLQT